MSEQECLEFIVQNGVTIPPEYDDLTALGAYVKKIIQTVEVYTDYPNFLVIV